MTSSATVLIIISVIFAVLVIIASLYFLVYFQHPEDKWTAWWPKLVVILGLSLSIYNVLLLPLDVANQGGKFNAAGPIPMATVELAFFLTTCAMGILVAPFAMFYYEGVDPSDDDDDGDKKPSATSQIFYGLKWTFLTLILFFGLNTILWYFEGYAEYTCDVFTTSFTTTELSPLDAANSIEFCGTAVPCDSTTGTQSIKVEYGVYVIALASLIGWLLFATFGGVGLVALPFDALMDFKYRPRPLKLSEYAEEKKAIGEQADLMMEASKELMVMRKEAIRANGRKGRKLNDAYRRKEHDFKRDVLLLDYFYHRLEDAYKNNGGNPLLHFANLLFGILGSLISIAWALHLILYNLPIAAGARSITPFLNTFFTLVGAVPFVGIVMYGIFVVWLLLCVIKGSIKMGMRLFFIQVHPMKIGDTMMSSLVFNVALILLSSLAVVQFNVQSFGIFAQYTATVALVSGQIASLRGLKYIYDALIYLFAAMGALTAVYVMWKPYEYQKRVSKFKF